MVSHYMPPHPGGIERVAETLYAAYRECGFAVRWLASDMPRGAPADDAGRLRVPAWNVLERRLGVPVPLWGPGGWRRLARLVRWADVVHVHDCLYPGSLAAAWLARRRGVPVLLTQHIGLVRYRSRLLTALAAAAYRTVGRAVLRRASAIALATPSAEQQIERLAADGGPRLRIPNGVDLERFRPPAPGERSAARAALGLPAGPVVLFVGRLLEKKGVPVVIETARRRPAVHFLVVGDGPLAGLVAAAGPNVTRLAAVPPAEMPRVYHAADASLLPSRGEGLPLSVQEAMACGVPVLVSADDAFSAGVAASGGGLAAPREAEAIAPLLDRLLAEPRAEAARRHAEARWSLTAMAQRYAGLVARLAAGQPIAGERGEGAG
jgi:glycosyltransferase involved in cell wall biosynthesis